MHETPHQPRRDGTAKPMGGVRTVAAIFGVIGWIILILYAVLVLMIFSQFGGRLGLVELASALALGLLASIGTFAVWGVLTGMCELHAQSERTAAQQERLLEMLDDIRRGNASGSGS